MGLWVCGLAGGLAGWRVGWLAAGGLAGLALDFF